MVQKITREQDLLLKIARNVLTPENFILNKSDLEGIDWEILIKLSNKLKIFPLVYKNIYKYVPEVFQAKYDGGFYNHVKNTIINIKELKRIAYLAKNHDIGIILIKGLALAKIIYNNLFLRQFSDIDILVNEADMIKMHNLFIDMGYFQEYGYDEINKKYKILPVILTIHFYTFALMLFIILNMLGGQLILQV